MRVAEPAYACSFIFCAGDKSEVDSGVTATSRYFAQCWLDKTSEVLCADKHSIQRLVIPLQATIRPNEPSDMSC